MFFQISEQAHTQSVLEFVDKQQRTLKQISHEYVTLKNVL